MVGFVRKKIIKGKTYYYFVYDYRIKTNVKQKILKYLGSVVPKKKVLEKLKNEFTLSEVEKLLAKKDYISKNFNKKDLDKFENLKDEFFKSLNSLSVKGKKELIEKFKTGFTYHSCSIEGNTLSLSQVNTYLNEKLSISGKHRFELLEIKNHDSALNFMIKHEEDLTEKFILNIHKILTKDYEEFVFDEKFYDYDPDFKIGEYRSDQRFIKGSSKMLPKAYEINEKMRGLITWYKKNKYAIHPLELASNFHIRFVDIHPFSDGNGRSARLLMNFILKRKGFPMIDITNKNREKYLEILESSNVKTFTNFLYEELKDYNDVLFNDVEFF